MPRPTRQDPHQDQIESPVVEHSSIIKEAIVFGSVSMRLLAIMPMA
jgi:hypothetical protein